MEFLTCFPNRKHTVVSTTVIIRTEQIVICFWDEQLFTREIGENM